MKLDEVAVILEEQVNRKAFGITDFEDPKFSKIIIVSRNKINLNHKNNK